MRSRVGIRTPSTQIRDGRGARPLALTKKWSQRDVRRAHVNAVFIKCYTTCRNSKSRDAGSTSFLSPESSGVISGDGVGFFLRRSAKPGKVLKDPEERVLKRDKNNRPSADIPAG